MGLFFEISYYVGNIRDYCENQHISPLICDCFELEFPKIMCKSNKILMKDWPLQLCGKCWVFFFYSFVALLTFHQTNQQRSLFIQTQIRAERSKTYCIKPRQQLLQYLFLHVISKRTKHTHFSLCAAAYIKTSHRECVS